MGLQRCRLRQTNFSRKKHLDSGVHNNPKSPQKCAETFFGHVHRGTTRGAPGARDK